MMKLARRWLNRFPRIKELLRRIRSWLPGYASTSSNFIRISGGEIEVESVRLRDSWQADDLPAKQRRLVDRQLALYRAGHAVEVFDVLVDSLKRLPEYARLRTVLEIGCSSGFYSEVFNIAKLPLTYTGCDYSQAFVGLAKITYPGLQFDVEDAAALTYPDNSFDVAVSGCCLLHIPEYEAAIAETARVAKSYAIFHRTPVLPRQPTMHFRKLAYGVETVEIHFGEQELLDLIAKHGLKVLDIKTMDEAVRQGVMTAVRTYVCSKVAT